MWQSGTADLQWGRRCEPPPDRGLARPTSSRKDSPLLTAIAIVLALVGSAVNAYAVVLQQHAVDATVRGDTSDPSRTVSLRRMLTLVRTPGWVAGIGLVVVAAGLHIGALVLAPITVIQPVGILAVLFAIVFASRRRRRWPGRRVWLSAGVTVAGITGFVAVATASISNDGHVPDESVLIAAGVVFVLAGICCVVGIAGPTWLRCVGWAAGCATVFGLASALLRSLSLATRAGTAWLNPTMIGIGIGLVLCYTVGGWLAQQAYASGPPEIVMSCLTAIDPLVAVSFGLVVLGEGTGIGPLAVVGMIIGGAVAIAGTVVLARHHPEATTS
ncbi:hypothetical protein [Microlunatus sp. Y2014]|uniref:hypothetical protein n=1 Tax=Microlunatus sp. Y2014 TaxID=3418488 RepID=UPI003DA6E9E3